MHCKRREEGAAHAHVGTACRHMLGTCLQAFPSACAQQLRACSFLPKTNTLRGQEFKLLHSPPLRGASTMPLPHPFAEHDQSAGRTSALKTCRSSLQTAHSHLQKSHSTSTERRGLTEQPSRLHLQPAGLSCISSVDLQPTGLGCRSSVDLQRSQLFPSPAHTGRTARAQPHPHPHTTSAHQNRPSAKLSVRAAHRAGMYCGAPACSWAERTCKAASVVRAAKSAPTKPCVSRAMDSRFTSSSSFMFLVWMRIT